MLSPRWQNKPMKSLLFFLFGRPAHAFAGHFLCGLFGFFRLCHGLILSKSRVKARERAPEASTEDSPSVNSPKIVHEKIEQNKYNVAVLL